MISPPTHGYIGLTVSSDTKDILSSSWTFHITRNAHTTWRGNANIRETSDLRRVHNEYHIHKRKLRKRNQLQIRAMASTRPTRYSYSPGFYRALNTCSTADFLERRRPCCTGKRGKLRVFAEEELPEGCFAVERVVSKKPRKVSHFDLCIRCSLLLLCR